MFSRAFFTLALLGGLGFGSYAFGKYVLSSRLFGNKGSKLNQNFGETTVAPIPRGKSSQNATASVEILPEGEENSGSRPAAPVNPRPNVVIDRSNTSGDDGSARSGTADIPPVLDTDPRPRRSRSSSASDDRGREEAPRPRRRRRRRPRPTPVPQTNIERERPVRQDSAPEPDVVISSEGDSGPSREDSSPAPRAERIEPRREVAREDAPDNDRPVRRRRTRVRTETPAPRERVRERVRIEPRRETPRQESPIPQPESGGGESPVPIPE